MSQHTPGPWIAGQGGDRHWRVYQQAIRGRPRAAVVCQFGEGQDEEWREHKNAEANARLIAAAPETVAELELTVDTLAGLLSYFVEGTHGWRVIEHRVRVARAAIRKALGEAAQTSGHASGGGLQ